MTISYTPCRYPQRLWHRNTMPRILYEIRKHLHFTRTSSVFHPSVLKLAPPGRKVSWPRVVHSSQSVVRRTLISAKTAVMLDAYVHLRANHSWRQAISSGATPLNAAVLQFFFKSDCSLGELLYPSARNSNCIATRTLSKCKQVGQYYLYRVSLATLLRWSKKSVRIHILIIYCILTIAAAFVWQSHWHDDDADNVDKLLPSVAAYLACHHRCLRASVPARKLPSYIKLH